MAAEIPVKKTTSPTTGKPTVGHFDATDQIDAKYIAQYRHQQGAAAATWTVAHNMNKFPQVTTIDSAGDQVLGRVVYVDANNLRIEFSVAFSGDAYLI